MRHSLLVLLGLRAAALALSVPERLRVGGMRLRSRPLKPAVRAQAANGDYLDSLDVSGGKTDEGFFMRNRPRRAEATKMDACLDARREVVIPRRARREVLSVFERNSHVFLDARRERMRRVPW